MLGGFRFSRQKASQFVRADWLLPFEKKVSYTLFFERKIVMDKDIVARTSVLTKRFFSCPLRCVPDG